MSSPNSPILTLDVRTRRVERYVASFALGAGACGVGLLNTLDLWLACATCAACSALVGVGLWRAGWIGSKHAIVHLIWTGDGHWQLGCGTANAVVGELSPHTRIGRRGVWLRWITSPGRQRTMLLTDADIRPQDLRRLKVRLRIEAMERALPEMRRA